MRTFMIAVCVLAFGYASHGAWAASDEETTTLTKVGDVAPPFDFTTLDGKHVDNASVKGKVVLLNFFAIWCVPCQKELPHVEALWQRLKSDDFVVIAAGREHSAEEMKTYNEEKKFTMLLAPDPERKAYSGYAQKYIPRTYVIDREGRIAFQSVGNTQDEFAKMTDEIEELLGVKKEEKKSEARLVTPLQKDAEGMSVPGLQNIEVHGEVRVRAQTWKGTKPRG